MERSEHAVDHLATIKAADLNPHARQRVAALLHVDLSDADELVVSLRRVIEVPTEDQRRFARERLLELLHRLDEQAPAVPDAEMEAIVDEAMHFVRPRR